MMVGANLYIDCIHYLVYRASERVNKEVSNMKRALFSLLLGVIVVGLSGCIARHGRHPFAGLGGRNFQTAETCDASCDESCGVPGDPSRKSCRRMRSVEEEEVVEAPQAVPGPPTGAVTYPYYTTRGPRDFLAKNPKSIGP